MVGSILGSCTKILQSWIHFKLWFKILFADLSMIGIILGSCTKILQSWIHFKFWFKILFSSDLSMVGNILESCTITNLCLYQTNCWGVFRYSKSEKKKAQATGSLCLWTISIDAKRLARHHDWLYNYSTNLQFLKLQSKLITDMHVIMICFPYKIYRWSTSTTS